MTVQKNTIGRFFFLILALLALLWICSCQSNGTSSDGESSYLADIPLESVLGNGKPTLAEFGWRKCIPCKEMRPILEELDKEYKGKANIVIVEIPFNEELTQKHGIMYMPTQIFFDSSGREASRHVGFLPKTDIIAQLEQMGVR